MRAERIFEKDKDFTELMFTLVDSFIEETLEKLYNYGRVNTVIAHTTDEKECVGL